MDKLDISGDERDVLYKYDEQLGWFPIENNKTIITGGTRTIKVGHNSRGFRDSEHIIDNRPRIVFLGDSFVWGYDVEKEERFTEKLRAKFDNLSIYNLGVSGYGTDQEYLLLKRHYDFYKPNIVFLVLSNGDITENDYNYRPGVYFKPYFIDVDGSLKLKGVPVPKSWRYFMKQHDVLSHSYCFRLFTIVYFNYMGPPMLHLSKDPTCAIITNIDRFVKMHGAEFIVGLHGWGQAVQKPKLEKYLKNNNIPFVDLTNSYIYPINGNHWTPDGHSFVSEKIYTFLIKGKYLQKATIGGTIKKSVKRRKAV